MSMEFIYNRLALTRRGHRPNHVDFWSWVFLIDARRGWFYKRGEGR